MRVTEGMTTEGGARLAEMADFLDVDDTGVQVTQDAVCVKLTVDSTAYPPHSAWLDPDDADALGDLLKLRAAECRKSAGL